MFCVAAGYAGFYLVPDQALMPLAHSAAAERLTEVVLIVALMGAGLKLDRRIGLHAWSTTWRLLGIAMPVCIGAVTLLGYAGLGLSLGVPLLLGGTRARKTRCGSA